jgi:glycosyltransferase involved in cell wall biosynthesis
MPRVSFITTCMGRLAHLRQTLPTWLVQPDSEVVVVDWSCPQGAGDWVEAAHPAARVVRVPGEAHFHLTRARNAGAAAATGEWLCFIDADVRMDPRFGAEVFPGLGEPARWGADGGPKEISGTVLCPRAPFEAIGGYDEAIQDWGSEDVDLYRRLAWLGIPGRSFPGRLLAPIEHGDELRVEHAVLKDKNLGWLVNMFYMEAKSVMMRMHGGELDLATRKGVYAEARKAVLESAATGRDGQLELSTGWQTLSGPAQVEHKLVFNLRYPH